ncbi:MerR family transcriptional regulator [Acidithiobacillus thiooxidans]|uniref:HTH-type transcriptional regulator ZntR n=1 Tax=Acidithiobacillus thiooxidans ATCC 19377 TaxID=637390 RepID=A0A543Q6I9_ACITH|nr:MerR family transcriptional regulator [Acidithiobacillus thiooxidans]MDX5933838.1 MerR family transcriptional regulator [Acidithiobacillus thiooxidans]TQN51944.1 HTH-type transcriptional regulator ZntR [Acidithiobacillus thiooxidans ATCC 19377]
MRIGELGQATCVDPETIRYYERIGLLPAPVRRANGYRAYGLAHLERLAFIRHCRALDMPLADVQRLLHLLDHPLDDCLDVDRLINTHLAHVQGRLQSLQALARRLSNCADAATGGIPPPNAVSCMSWWPLPKGKGVCATTVRPRTAQRS